jgi:hypothetical protein
MRVPFVVGNWKLHKQIGDAVALATELKNQLGTLRDVEVGIAPPFTALHAVAKRLEGSKPLPFRFLLYKRARAHLGLPFVMSPWRRVARSVCL